MHLKRVRHRVPRRNLHQTQGIECLLHGRPGVWRCAWCHQFNCRQCEDKCRFCQREPVKGE